ncbi:carboxymuconolactone decarboxylase family protein [Ensifer sp. BR816]|uniref:carboxymuconolactone decarboxylase family protein n=1 Tax=Rhizobium sp. (strain BR816) TaxID=1057002 RepID=UPI001FD87FFD|nr:carboxymuconolactone decarboxylase family protein [Ensifer sp. BR816]
MLRGLHAIEDSGANIGRRVPTMRDLIALAVAVTTRCCGCIAVHAKKRQIRASTEESDEALGVAIEALPIT